MPKLIINFLLGALVLSFAFSCSIVEKQLFKQKRPYEERAFDSAGWKAGDEQMRGEMSKDLLRGKRPAELTLFRKGQDAVREILGKPDRKARGKCCGAGVSREVEVWLYTVSVKDRDTSEISTEHFQIYFTTSGEVDETRIAKWDDKDADYFPRVG